MLGLIRASHELSVRSHALQRERRDTAMNNAGQKAIDSFTEGSQELEEKVKRLIDEIKSEMEKICKKVMKATNAITALDTQDTSCGTQWTEAQEGLRDGIRLVIKSYEKYIEVQRQICREIEDFANDMIEKYKDELNAIDHMSAPSATSDANSDAWKRFFTRMPSMVNYACMHHRTLPTAADCTADLMTHTIQLRQVITRLPPPSQMKMTYVVHSAAAQYPGQHISLPCGDVTDDNGYQTCPMALVGQTRDYADAACGRCI